MTDRELLDLAAKAAGIELIVMAIKPAEGEGDGFIGFMTEPDQWKRGWFNPLADDGDALRLAVKLEINIQHEANLIPDVNPYEFAPTANCGQYADNAPEWVEEFKGADPLAATRRAIVRAAASIGRAMP